jgi:hypothetical protein
MSEVSDMKLLPSPLWRGVRMSPEAVGGKWWIGLSVDKNMATKKKGKSNYEEVLILYEKLVATNKKIERKGATMPYTSFNGHMFSFLDKNGALALRLPEEAKGEFIKKYKTKPFEAYGKPLKEYVLVPEKLLKDRKVLKPYFNKSFEYVKTLKPKTSKR